MTSDTAAPSAAATPAPTMLQRLTAEAIGIFILVFAGIGTALYAGDAVGNLGIGLAVGLTVFVGCAAWGSVSGGHFNPAVTVGLAAAGRFAWRDVPLYIVAQLIGAIVGSTALYLIAMAAPSGWLESAQSAGFASNGFDNLSPAGFGIGAAIAVEIILTAVFVLIIANVTSAKHGTKLAPLAIGLTLTLIHLVSIPVDGTSVNPGRSIATAIYGGGDALAQVWVFIVFPIVGALLAGWLHRAVFERKQAVVAA